MATSADFRAQFPEFTQVADATVNPILAAALLEIDPDVWGVKADQGQLYLAAHKLALSPFGNNAKMVTPAGKGTHGTTYYGQHYDSLVMQVASGFRVA